MRDETAAATEDAAGAAGHALLPHTADAGIRAWGPDLPRLFAETGLALAEQIADIKPGTPPTAWIPVRLEAVDLAGLAFAWLNGLIGEAEIARGGLAALDVGSVTHALDGSWHLEGRVGIAPFDGTAVRVRRPPKSATYHGLAIDRLEAGWSLRAYLDV